MATFAEALEHARRLLAGGEWAAAEVLYRRLIEAAPGESAPWHELGILHLHAGQPRQAVECLRQALVLDPREPAVSANLAAACLAINEPREAIAVLRQALQNGPATVELWNNLALVLKDVGDTAAALAALDEALLLRPDFANGHFNRGNVLSDVGCLAEAAVSYRRATELRPDDPFAHCQLGVTHAELARREADSPRLHRQLATAALERALLLKPDYREAHGNLGRLAADQDQLDAAVAHYRRALALKPDYADALNNLALVFVDQGQPEAALDPYRRAVALEPDFVAAHFNYANALLSLGRFAEGWPELEWRWRRPDDPDPPFSQPRWTGEPLPHGTLLLRGEYGLGDTLQFVRYAQLARQRARRVILEAPAGLLPLLAQSGCDDLVACGAPLPEFDAHARLMSLPGIFGTTLETIPREVPYLAAQSARVEQWRGVVRQSPGFQVGIAWQGNPRYQRDRLRSVPLVHFASLAESGAELISLQRGFGVEQLAGVADRFRVRELGEAVDRDCAFVDTAAILMSLDLVITSDSALAHLAGGLGVPVWTALPRVPDWRWLLEREDCPWYPTMRLFRQRRQGDWPEVFQRMADALREEIARRTPAAF